MGTADGRGALNYTVHKPVGVVAVIAPWNLPFLLLTWKVAPALACGNTVVAKPSEETPSSAALLAEVMQEVGVPPGVFNLVHGFGPGSAGEALVRHPDVDAIAFTGESATGTAIMKSAADSVKALSFELGGKNAALVFADADFDAALAGTMRSVFSNCGQVCLCSERVYVERPIFERFLEALVRHPDVNAIAFTGESATGTAIMKSAADSVKALSFELGGKNAALVFADADFEAALAGTMRSVFSNCGQVCLCSERVYVERPIFARFLDALATRARALKIGGPYEGADMGPLISRSHRDKVLSYYRLARTEHGEIVCGGGVPAFGDERDAGAFIEPTIIRGLPEDARCVKEEIFGPVCHVAPFDSEEEAVRLANDTRYGLAAALWTSNLQRAHRVARQMEVGITWVNDWFLRDLRTPFGGVKLSGIGREGGVHSLAFFSEPMNICVKL